MVCTHYDSKRARALQTSFYLLGRHRDAMRQWLKKRLSELLYALTGLKCLCLSINKHTRYHLGVCHPLIHRAVLLSRIIETGAAQYTSEQ